MASEPVKVRLLDREFLVACSEDERPGLIAAADLLDSRMRDLRNSAGNPGFDRIAVLVALSIAHEYLSQQSESERREKQLGTRLDSLTQRLESALNDASGSDA